MISFLDVYVAPLAAGSLPGLTVAAALAYLGQGRVDWWARGWAGAGTWSIHLLVLLLASRRGAWTREEALGVTGVFRIDLARPAPSPWTVAVLGSLLLSLALAAGLVFIFLGRPGVLLWGLAGLAAGAASVLWPQGRPDRGLGRAAVVLAFGPLLTAGAAYALTGRTDLVAAGLGLPLGLSVVGAVFPPRPETRDDQPDLTRRWAWLGRLGLLLLALAGLIPLALLGGLGWLVLAGLAPLPLALAAATAARRGGAAAPLRVRRLTSQVHLALALLLALALVGERLLRV
jgi:hypothetical protein